MKKKLLFCAFLISYSFIVHAQLFEQDFSSSNVVSSYISGTPNSGQFSGMSPDGANVSSSINNGALRFNRTGTATIYAYRNFSFTTIPTFVQFKMDFEAIGNVVGSQTPIFSVFLGSNFSSTSSGTTSDYASRFGILAQSTVGNFKIGTIDNVGGAPQTAEFSGKQTITFIVNNSGSNQTYLAPDGSTESVVNQTMDVWIGTTRGINDFSLRNTASPKADITGFKIQATSQSGTGIYDFDNIEMRDLINDPVTPPTINLPDTPPAYLSLTYPRIWTSYAERQAIVDNIEQHPWAASMYNQLVGRQQAIKNSHAVTPSTLLSTIPAIPGDRDTHRELLNTAVECGILYFLTDDESYAQVAADILYNYNKLISVQNPLSFEFYQPNFNHLIPARELFPRVAMAYDFVRKFIVNAGTTVYDKDSNTRVAFNFTTSQQAFEVMANNVIQVGGNNSNHPVLELPGALFSVLCMENDTTKANFFNTLLNGAANSTQPGINWMLSRFSAEERLWPESAGYAKFTHAAFIKIMYAVDRYRPDLNIIANNQDLLESIFIYENFLYPNGDTMAYGDIGRSFIEHAHIFESIMKIADNKGYTVLKDRAATTLKKIYAEKGGYTPVIETDRLEYTNPLQLLWGLNIDASVSDAGEPKYGTVKATHAGVIMQRNYSGVNDEQNGLMYYSGGGTYVHAHASGLDMELYGAGYVIGPDYGDDTYGTPIHEEYAVSYAAHNTIIVNGTSGRGPKTNGNSTWQNIVDPIILQAAEPKVYARPIAQNFSFASQFLEDNQNNLDQQRTNSIIRTSPTSGYYVDIFRSNSNTVNNFHDYLFHGLGDVMQINSGGSPLNLTDTPNRYQNDVGDERKQPGWRWFSNAKTSALTANAISARFDIQFDNKYLHVNVPGGISKEYSSALAPPTKEVNNGYSNKDTQMFIMRKYGEAWNEPFVAIYEPSGNSVSTIKSTTNILHNTKVVGVKVVSEVNGQEIKDYILSNDNDNTALNLTDLNLSFTGRFAVVRTEVKGATTDVSLYIGKGQQLTFLGQTLNSDIDGKAYLEYTLNYALSTSDRINSQERILAFPNPTNGSFEINVPKALKNINLEVYNIQVQLISSKSYDVKNGKVSLDLGSNSNGIYFVKLNIDKPVYVKIIKN